MMKYYAIFAKFSTSTQTDTSVPYMIAVFVIFVLMLLIFTAFSLRALRKLKGLNNDDTSDAAHLKPENPFTRKAEK